MPAWYQIWSRYISRCLMAMIEGGYSQVQVTADASDEYTQALDFEAIRDAAGMGRAFRPLGTKLQIGVSRADGVLEPGRTV